MRIGAKKLFSVTIIDKIFETNFRLYVKWCIIGKVQFLFFKDFLPALTKFKFYEED